MLVLSRKESERIRLGNSIVVTVVRVSGDKVRLGIDAPPDVLVLREELEVHVVTEGPGLMVEVAGEVTTATGQPESLTAEN
ncbi:MAG: carbon storage regulator [Planctomycetes bacterium]|nr:carbon storage regulator [Planctomycetota bacterium]